MTPLPDLLRPSLWLPAPLPAVVRVGAPAYPRKALARLAAGMLCGLPLAVLAQTSAWDAPLAQLRASPVLSETIPEAVRPQLPVFISGEHITGQPDVRAVIEGDAELRRGDTVIRARRMEYTVPDDLARASGQVRINRAGNVYQGTALELRVDAFEGFFTDARYQFLRNGAHGDAVRVDFIDRDRAEIHHATYTTCTREEGEAWRPDWVLRADRIRIDQEDESGWAENAVLEFQGVPLLPIPYISFPLSDKRKSGLLPPTVGLDSVNGFEYAQPYYWNIAPNRDATLQAALMAKRGLQLGGEFRYLEPSYQGQLRADILPSDRVRDRTRWSYALQHSGVIPSAVGGLGLNLNLHRVSDDNYWRDFARGSQQLTQLAQRLLPGDAQLSWAGGDFSMQVRALKWQTLQDVTAPIVPPYDRLPQWQWRYVPTQLAGGFDARVELDATRFQADRSRTGQPNAQRSYALAQISRPFLAPAGFVTPRLQMHASHYQFDSVLANGARSASRVLPTFSVDSGLFFERDTQYFGRAFLQTLEPRAFYTYTPYRDQSLLPVYDTAANDFNFATIYTENAFGGQDRIADNNLLTLGVTTRLLDPATGAEAARFGVAQRLRFSDQQVTLPGVPAVSERLSDVMLGAGVTWTPQWSMDSTLQFNPKTGRSIRATIGGRYQPGDYRVLSMAYRLQRGTSEQVDVGWQWPLDGLWGGKGAESAGARGQGGRWYSVGRLNYSLQDRKLVDTVVGIEYDSCCWIGRVVLERLQNSLTSANTRLLFQIEFVGFSRLSLGSNPLSSLKQNIPGYRYLRDQVSTPSRFSNYD
ncbi:LPS-assembly protein LptD [Simplicispira lacusdiani]|uniref:LPS-assembly protein LptD n=1 Tax=Simplicispira lacusdiani TaxID=2213010 RepID=UPI003522EF23